jgi:hypothetical protein
VAIPAQRMNLILTWPAIAGGLSALVVAIVGASVIEQQRRIRSRRAQLRSRLFK